MKEKLNLKIISSTVFGYAVHAPQDLDLTDGVIATVYYEEDDWEELIEFEKDYRGQFGYCNVRNGDHCRSFAVPKNSAMYSDITIRFTSMPAISTDTHHYFVVGDITNYIENVILSHRINKAIEKSLVGVSYKHDVSNP